MLAECRTRCTKGRQCLAVFGAAPFLLFDQGRAFTPLPPMFAHAWTTPYVQPQQAPFATFGSSMSYGDPNNAASFAGCIAITPGAS